MFMFFMMCVSIALLLCQVFLLFKKSKMKKVDYLQKSLYVYAAWAVFCAVQLVYAVSTIKTTGSIVLWSILFVLNGLNVPLSLNSIKIEKLKDSKQVSTL